VPGTVWQSESLAFSPSDDPQIDPAVAGDVRSEIRPGVCLILGHCGSALDAPALIWSESLARLFDE
jgi:hypothetical protein